MYTLVIILTIIAALLLIVVVLVQKSKGGGLSSTFGGGNQIMGVRRTTDFIEKATWTLASVICILAIVSVFVMPRNVVATSKVEQAPAAPTTEFPAAAPETPAAPAEVPAELPVAPETAE